MDELTRIILYTLAAGACIPLGGALAHVERIRSQWLQTEFRHAVIAFGGGILIAAVVLVLVPEGTAYVQRGVLSVLVLFAGGLCFFALERYAGVRRRERPQFVAMLLDYVPESLALGGAFAAGSHAAPLLAAFIGLQNLPEGFNAYRELRAGSQSDGRVILALMCALIPLGPLVALLGWFYLSEQVVVLGAVMLFASGGILYLIFQDIAPQSHVRHHWGPPLGAVGGFCLGMLGNNLVAAA